MNVRNLRLELDGKALGIITAKSSDLCIAIPKKVGSDEPSLFYIVQVIPKKEVKGILLEVRRLKEALIGSMKLGSRRIL